MTVSPLKVNISDEEIEIIERFVGTLDNVGVLASLYVSAIDEAPDTSAGELLGIFKSVLNDVKRMSAQEMYNVAPAFLIVSAVAESADIFPDDFLPSKEITDLLMLAFWESHRN